MPLGECYAAVLGLHLSRVSRSGLLHSDWLLLPLLLLLRGRLEIVLICSPVLYVVLFACRSGALRACSLARARSVWSSILFIVLLYPFPYARNRA